MKKREGWTRLSAPGRKCDARWRHKRSGWEVRHCGHPTANWPYFAVDPKHPEASTMSHNGRGFRDLERAFDAVEDVISGAQIATGNACVAGVRRICHHNDLSEETDARP